MVTPDPVKKAVKNEKKRLKERAELIKKQKELEIESLNATPSRVKVDAGKELVIEPTPLLNNISSYIFSYDLLGDLGGLIGYTTLYVAVLNVAVFWVSSDRVSAGLLPISIRDVLTAIVAVVLFVGFVGKNRYTVVFLTAIAIGYARPLLSQLPIPITERLIGIGIFVFALIYHGKDYVVDAVKKISELNEPFHLTVSGKNFMVHSGNPEEYIAASTKVGSDGNRNIMAEIDEVKGSLSFTWVYGPDINNLTTGGREFTKHPGISSQPYFNLSDMDLIRKFLNDNGIEISCDRRINE